MKRGNIAISALLCIAMLMIACAAAYAETIISPEFRVPASAGYRDESTQPGDSGEEQDSNETQEEEKPRIDLSNVQLGIDTNLDPANLKTGDVFRMTALISGLDDAAYKITWQVDDGSGWTNIRDAHGTDYSLVVNETNSGWNWRYVIDVDDAEGED